MSSGERPIGAAKGKQPNTEALCQSPPPRSAFARAPIPPPRPPQTPTSPPTPPQVSKIVECLPLSKNVGAGDGANVELSHQEWEIVRVRPSRTVPDHMDMVTATLRSHLSSEQLLELIDLYKKQKGGRRRAGPENNLQLEDMPTPAARVDAVCFLGLFGARDWHPPPGDAMEEGGDLPPPLQGAQPTPQPLSP